MRSLLTRSTSLLFAAVGLVTVALPARGQMAPLIDAGTVGNRSLLDAVTSDWRDDTSKDVKLSQYKGQTTVLSMDAPRCERGTCSMTLDALKDVDKMLAQQGRPAQIVVVVLDPHATPVSLAALRQDAGLGGAANWHFLIGDLPSTQSLAQMLGVRYGEKDGHIVHTFRALILGADGAIETEVQIHPNEPATGGTAPVAEKAEEKPRRIVDMLREDEERAAAAAGPATHHRVPALRSLQR